MYLETSFTVRKNLLARIGGIQMALSGGKNPYMVRSEKELVLEYNQVLHQEEMFWYQKSRC
jgi:hypothetical protein